MQSGSINRNGGQENSLDQLPFTSFPPLKGGTVKKKIGIIGFGAITKELLILKASNLIVLVHFPQRKVRLGKIGQETGEVFLDNVLLEILAFYCLTGPPH